MVDKPTMTTSAGAPVPDNQNSESAGARGPLLLQDYQLLEKLAHQNRERIPERVVHAKGWGAFGTLTITNDISKYTIAKVFGEVGKKTDLLIRFSTVAGESPSPTSEEIGRVVIETRVGRDLTSALRATAARMKNDDFLWVADAITIQQEVGGNLAEVLDAVGGTIRDRNQIRRQIHTLSAEGRISAVVLIALPFVAAGLLAAANPGYLDPLFTTRRGITLLVIGGLLIVLGILWIRRIVKIVF